MMQLFNKVSAQCSRLVTQSYSTSFSTAVNILSPEIRDDIYNIYGFVRFADEIVDTFHDYPKEKLLAQFDAEYKSAIANKISLNPILHAFQLTVNKYNIDPKLIEAFMDSMRADLHKQVYTSQEEMQKYVYGSAEVVGLMCLKIFVKGSESEYTKLEQHARSLGSAFQKVNFLRDLKADFSQLERSYFPNVDIGNLSTENKNKIIVEIEAEFAHALIGIKMLPKESRMGVYVAYKYYCALLAKIKNMPAQDILKQRVRVSNANKFLIVVKSYLNKA
jgi:15-cis-phytoene synthase